MSEEKPKNLKPYWDDDMKEKVKHDLVLSEEEQITQIKTRDIKTVETILRCFNCGIQLGFTTITKPKKQYAVCCYCKELNRRDEEN